jgi:hypothetical protein
VGPAASVPAAVSETVELRYLRQIRNAVTTLAVIAVLGVIGSIIAIIVAIVAINHESSVLQGGSPNPSSTCLSQGGFDPSC